MALTDVIGRIFGPAFQTEYYQANIWPQLAADLSSELPFGDTLELPSDATTYALNSRTATQARSSTVTDHARSAPAVVNGSKVNLVVTEYDDVDVLIPTAAQNQVRPSFVSNAIFHSARIMSERLSNDIREKFDALTGTSVLGNIAVTAANFGNAAHVTLIMQRIRDADKSMNAGHLPRPGRYLSVGPTYYDLILQQLIDDKLFLVTGATDNAVVNAQIPRYRGFDIVMDDSLGVGETATDDANHNMYFGLRGEGISYATQVRNLRAFESENYKGIRVTGDLFHGNLVNQPSKVRIAKTVIS